MNYLNNSKYKKKNNKNINKSNYKKYKKKMNDLNKIIINNNKITNLINIKINKIIYKL